MEIKNLIFVYSACDEKYGNEFVKIVAEISQHREYTTCETLFTNNGRFDLNCAHRINEILAIFSISEYENIVLSHVPVLHSDDLIIEWCKHSCGLTCFSSNLCNIHVFSCFNFSKQKTSKLKLILDHFPKHFERVLPVEFNRVRVQINRNDVYIN